MKNSLKYSAAAITLAFALSGCLRIEMDLVLQPDDTVDGSMVFAVQEGLGESFGSSDEEVAASLGGEDNTDFANSTTEEYKQDGYIGSRTVFTDEPLENFSEDDLSLVREGDDYVLSGTFDVTGGEEGSDQILASSEMSLSVTFPGAIKETNGTVTGKTVTWDLANAPADGLYARGSASAGLEIPVWAWGILGLIILGGVAGFLVMQDRRSKAAAATAAPEVPVGELPKATDLPPLLPPME